MDKDVAEQRAHEEQRCRARILDAQRTRLAGPAEVPRHDRKGLAGRAVVGAGGERKHERRSRTIVEIDSDVLRDRVRREGNPFLREAPENSARIRRVGGLEIEDALGQDDGAPHGLVEEGLLRFEVPEDRRRRDAELAGDVGECGGLDPLQGKDAPGGVEDLVARDARRTAHL